MTLLRDQNQKGKHTSNSNFKMFIVTTVDTARNASINVTGIIQEKKGTNPIANGDINSYQYNQLTRKCVQIIALTINMETNINI